MRRHRSELGVSATLPASLTNRGSRGRTTGWENRTVDPRVAVVGVGHAGFAPVVSGLSTKELMFEAAQRAYHDAGVDPRSDVDSFVCCSEDLLEGTSIFDESVRAQ